MSNLEAVKTAIKNFEELQKRFASVGAQDTEPDGVFQSLLMRAVRGKDVKIPLGADEWELYEGNDAVASELSTQAKKVVKLIQNCPIGNSRALVSFLEEYCWRVF